MFYHKIKFKTWNLIISFLHGFAFLWQLLYKFNKWNSNSLVRNAKELAIPGLQLNIHFTLTSSFFSSFFGVNFATSSKLLDSWMCLIRSLILLHFHIFLLYCCVDLYLPCEYLQKRRYEPFESNDCNINLNSTSVKKKNSNNEKKNLKHWYISQPTTMSQLEEELNVALLLARITDLYLFIHQLISSCGST